MTGSRPPSTLLFEPRQVRRAFSRASTSYHAAAELQHAIEAELLQSLDFLDLRRERADAPVAAPALVVDLGSGPGTAATAMQRRWPAARVLALDLALPMLRQARGPRDWRHPLARRPHPVCADARALPLADGSVDVLFSNLCLQWVDDLPGVFAGFRRVLKPGALLLCSTFGPDTLRELREAFTAAEPAGTVQHVSPFATIAQFGDALLQAGFRDPVLDRDVLVRGYQDVPALMHALRAMGATNALASRRRTLTGRARFRVAAAAYEQERRADGLLPASWEVITAMAWAPDAGAPIRAGGVDEVRVPADSIRIRRRP